MTPLFSFLAQQAPAPDAGPMGSMLVPMVLMMAMMYFLMIRPQQKRQKELEKQIEAIKVGDLVVTTGGMHGMVANKGDKVVTLRVADNVRIKFDSNAIARVYPKGAADAPVIEG
ncbi:MAG: preprotein translocase subunit YajC [Verrucomicrobia bacterium]|jgi:preprotein translocase subunit YajC|nr:MAG: preprotein translocase subunit YajC [Verrucomicrobiota bacterium]